MMTLLPARLGAALCVALFVAACRSELPPLVCPAGAELQIVQYPDERDGGYGERCVRPDGTRNGPSRDFYEDGTLHSETSWLDGERHGKTTIWHANGVKAAEVEHNHWMAVGLWTNWDDQGRVTDQHDFGSDGANVRMPPPVMPEAENPHAAAVPPTPPMPPAAAGS